MNSSPNRPQQKDSRAESETDPVGEGHDVVPAKGEAPEEAGGPAGLEPTRYGDWERKGRCIDF